MGPLFAWLLPTLLLVALSLALVPKMARLTKADPRSTRRRTLRLHASLLAGALAGSLSFFLEESFTRLTGLDPRAQALGSGSALLALALFTPLGEALKLLAFAPALRAGWAKGRLGSAFHATALALGYATVDAAFYLRGAGELDVARALLSAPAHVFTAATWSYAYGRSRSLGKPGKKALLLAWLGATLLRGLYDHLLFGRGLATIIAAIPLLAAMVLVAYLVARPLLAEKAPGSLPSLGGGLLPALPPPPSIRAVRAALRRAERPATLRWIAFGSLVTTGVMITAVALAVIAAHRLGIDFSVVDEGEVTSTLPLVMLGSSVLAAFPVAGFLIARASATGSLLEPAMSSAVAITGTLVMLGLAAPVAVVFGLAFAPVAFVLACAGAWVGADGVAR